MMNKKRLNNKGFSLVELIVVVLITSVMMLGVIAFMSTSRSAYQTVNISTTLQEESMTVKRVLSEYLMESQAFGYQQNVSVDGSMKNVLWILARETEDNSYNKKVYFFVMDGADKKLRFCKGDSTLVNPNVLESLNANAPEYIKDHCYNDGGKYSVVAEHIESLSLTKSKRPDDSYLVCVKLKYRYPDGNGKEYYDEITVTTRNKYASSSSGSGSETSDSGSSTSGGGTGG